MIDRVRHILRTQTLRQSEIENLGGSPFRNENVGGFDVTMNYALVVSGIERVGNLDRNGDHAIGIERACCYKVLQRYAIQVLHRYERVAFVASNFVDGADIWVTERRCISCFTTKTQ